MTKYALFWATAATLLMGVTDAAQQPSAPPTAFRVDVNYVEVDAVVTNRQGEFVRGLTKDDFAITENGRAQELSLLSLVDIPIDRTERWPSTTSVEPDVHTNVREYDGRVFTLVLDDLHTDALRSQQVRAAARRFVDRHMGPNDLAAVVYASGRSEAGQYFSGNPRLLRAAIGEFIGKKPRTATLQRADDFFSSRRPPEEDIANVRIDDPLLKERGDLARVLLERLRNISDSMAAVRGRRKALVLFSEGIDYDVHNQFDGQVASMITNLTQETIAAANRANMAIYAVDPRGVTALGGDIMEMTELPSPEYHRLDIGTTGLQNELRRAHDSLRVLADETGGVAALNTNEYAGLFDRVMRDSSTYYVLGYYPRDDRRDGRFRKIDVRVRRNGLQVRARKGYRAAVGAAPDRQRVDAGSTTPAALREALQNPVPLNGLGLSTFAAAFKSDAPSSSVLVGVEIAGRDLRLAEHDDVFSNAVEFALVAIDYRGRVSDGNHLTVPFKLRPEAVAAMSGTGLRLFSRLSLPPGRYQLRLAAAESVGGRVGSVHHYVEVPDFSQGPLAMSSLLVTSASARHTLTVNPEARLADVLPASPTARREFTVDDSLALFLEVYDNAASHANVVDIVTTLHDADGRVVFRTEQSRTADELSGRVGSYGYGARIPLRKLPPGPYVLRVAAGFRLAGEKPISRETMIRVVPSPATP